LRGLLDEPSDERLRIAIVAVHSLADDGSEAAYARRPFIEGRGEVVLRCAGKHGAILDQRESSLVTVPPRGLDLGGVKLRVCVAAQALG
jgi:hypothetical protein